MQSEKPNTDVPWWSWGKNIPAMAGTIPSPWDTSPRIEGRAVILVPDIRKTPGGDKWHLIEDRRRGSELLIRVNAVATDRFTLYIEANSLENNHRSLIGGIHLDHSDREAGAVLTEHIVRFQHPLQKEWPYIDLQKALLPANNCTLSEQPKLLDLELLEVEVRKKLNGTHNYLLRSGMFSDGKLLINVDHDFPVTGFKLEYEHIIWEDFKRILNAELFAIEDHSITNCTCKRKERISSRIQVELSKFGPEKPDTIFIWGPNVTICPDEFMINHSSDFTEYQ
jgi:hypothetical protein